VWETSNLWDSKTVRTEKVKITDKTTLNSKTFRAMLLPLMSMHRDSHASFLHPSVSFLSFSGIIPLVLLLWYRSSACYPSFLPSILPLLSLHPSF
jgi:hypothetical protein